MHPRLFIFFRRGNTFCMKAIEFLQKNKKHAVYALIGLCLLLLGLFSGMLIGPAGGGAEETPASPDAADVLSVLPSARVEFRVNFEACGHDVTTLQNESLGGKTREEAEQAYPGWTLASFSKNAVLFTKAVQGFCPQHYVLLLSGEELGVYRTDEISCEPKRLMVLDWDEASFDSTERAELKAGLAFDDLEGVNAYLESAES